MKICLITDNFIPTIGGVSNVLGNIYKQFQETNHKLYVINQLSQNNDVFKLLRTKTFSNKDLLKFFKSKKFYKFLAFSFCKIITDTKISLNNRIHLILYLITKPKLLIRVIYNIEGLYPFLKQLDFDILLAGQSGWLLPLVFVLSRIFNKKLVTMAYGNDFLIRSSLTLKSYYFRNTDKIIVINRQMKKIIKKMHGLDEKQLEIIYVGLNLEEFEVNKTKKEIREEFNIPEKEFILLSVGRHVPRKKFDLVIKAVSEIKKLNPSINIKYVLIGEGKETPYLKNLSKQLNIEKQIEFLGSCETEKRNKYYKLSDVFLMPVQTKKNDIEGFGIVFLEANYYKVPVIGTATGGIVEAIKDGETGFLIKPNDLNDLVEKILHLYNDEELRKKMGEIGHSRVLNEFSWNKIINDYIYVFENLK